MMNLFATSFSLQKGVETVLPVLMLTGSNIVQTALATTAGTPSTLTPPVAYSFGWVTYLVSAMLAACKGHAILPAPDCHSVLINARSGHARENKSWVLARLLHDYAARPRPAAPGSLSVVFLRAVAPAPARVRAPSRLFVLSTALLLLQLALACAPALARGSYTVLCLTLSGTLMALAAQSLPQWAAEKGAARAADARRRDVVCLTQGNGARVALVVVSEGVGLRLEDLAAGRFVASAGTAPAMCLLALLAVAHLLVIGALSSDVWYLFAVIALGTVQNMVIASARLAPHELGMPLVEEKVVEQEKVFATLQAAEAAEPFVGLALLPIFFPGGLREEEVAWAEARRLALEEPAIKTKGREYV